MLCSDFVWAFITVSACSLKCPVSLNDIQSLACVVFLCLIVQHFLSFVFPVFLSPFLHDFFLSLFIHFHCYFVCSFVSLLLLVVTVVVMICCCFVLLSLFVCVCFHPRCCLFCLIICLFVLVNAVHVIVNT